MSESHWRTTSREVIQRVIAEVGREDEARLRKAISDAYPFGMRRYYPYKVWLNEVQKQLHPEKFVPMRRTKAGGLVKLPPLEQMELLP